MFLLKLVRESSLKFFTFLCIEIKMLALHMSEIKNKYLLSKKIKINTHTYTKTHIWLVFLYHTASLSLNSKLRVKGFCLFYDVLHCLIYTRHPIKCLTLFFCNLLMSWFSLKYLVHSKKVSRNIWVIAYLLVLMESCDRIWRHSWKLLRCISQRATNPSYYQTHHLPWCVW